MPVNSSIWQRSGEIVILFATLTALGALSRTASADPSWNDDRAQVINTEMKATAPAPAEQVLDPGLAELGDKPAAASAEKTAAAAPVAPATNSGGIEALEDDLDESGSAAKPASGPVTAAATTPTPETTPASSEAPRAEPVAAKAAEAAPQAQPEKKAAVVAEPKHIAIVAEPNAGIECLAGCYDSKPVEKLASRKSAHVTLSGHLASRLAEPVRTGKHQVKSGATLASSSAGAVWPKRRALCMANCPPDEQARTRAVYETVPELRERINVALPEAWLGVPLQQVATGDALTMTGTMRPSAALVSRSAVPGILRNFRAR